VAAHPGKVDPPACSAEVRLAIEPSRYAYATRAPYAPAMRAEPAHDWFEHRKRDGRGWGRGRRCPGCSGERLECFKGFGHQCVERAARRPRSRLAEIKDCRRALDDQIALTVRAGTLVTHAAQISRQSVYEALARSR
jgi:hypothetical protein